MTDNPNTSNETLRRIADAHRVALRRVECMLQQAAEHEANTDAPWVAQFVERAEARAQRVVKRIFGDLPGFFIGGDPRGYQLKVAEEHAGDLHRDWGNDGILAPAPDDKSVHQTWPGGDDEGQYR